MKMKATSLTSLLGVLSLALVLLKCDAEQCGWQAGGKLCPTQICCSEYGWCGTTEAYCGKGCQSNCTLPAPPAPTPPAPSSPIKDIFPEEMFEEFLKHRNDAACPAKGFYNYYAFITAANYYPHFANTGDLETRKRELAAFFGQTSHETTGGTGWDPPGGSDTWGYCFVEEVGAHGIPGLYCDASNNEWPCVEGKSYYGRGPIQLSYNYNYGPAGVALGYDLLSEPDLVHLDAVISFQAALWFWMTPQSPKPSCHDVITGQWTPSLADIEGNRLPGYGVITNIINGGLECNIAAPDARQEDRISFYKRYCDLFGITYGDNLECYDQRPFNWGLFLKGLSST